MIEEFVGIDDDEPVDASHGSWLCCVVQGPKRACRIQKPKFQFKLTGGKFQLER